MYESLKKLITEAKETGKSLHDVILLEEMESTERKQKDILTQLQHSLKVMRESLERGLEEKVTLPIDDATEQSQKLTSTPVFLSKDLKEAVYWAMSIEEYNSDMGVICAAPTAGSAGVFPAVIFKAQEILEKSDEDLLHATLVGAGIGTVIGNSATTAGAEGGCQAEIGTASAMAAGAITYFAGGSLEMVENAVGIALKNILGLVCDPVAGLVITPCISRNAMGVVNAFLAAEMALSKVDSIIPADEIIEAMGRVGRKLPEELRETGKGGIANTPTAKKIEERLFKDTTERED